MTEREMCELYKMGMSIQAVAWAEGTSPQKVRRVLVRNGIKIRKSGWRMIKEMRLIAFQKELDNSELNL